MEREKFVASCEAFAINPNRSERCLRPHTTRGKVEKQQQQQQQRLIMAIQEATAVDDPMRTPRLSPVPITSASPLCRASWVITARFLEEERLALPMLLVLVDGGDDTLDTLAVMLL